MMFLAYIVLSKNKYNINRTPTNKPYFLQCTLTEALEFTMLVDKNFGALSMITVRPIFVVFQLL
jgi:hypothetical protein